MTRVTKDLPWKRAAITSMLGTAVVVAMLLGFLVPQRHQFQHHNDRVVRALASASSIQVQFRTKQTSTQAAFTATGILFPRVDPVTQQLTFDGRLSYDYLGQEYNFTMIHNRGYMTVEDSATRSLVRNDCLDRDSVPPVELFVDALRDARVIDAAENHAVDCADGKLVEFHFANEPYVFCSRANGAIDKVHGDDLEATVQLLRDNTEAASAPRLESLQRPGTESVDVCEMLVDSRRRLQSQTLKATATRMLSRARDMATVLTGRRRLADEDNCATACKDGKKVCLFVHGLGKDLDAPVADTYAEAWGEAAWEDMKCCTQTKFVRMDTVNYPWYTALLANKVCDAAIALTQSKDPMQLENIAIISHSMGNLIVASAAVKEICAIGPTSKWIALAGPISGSHTANVGTSSCSGSTDPKDQAINSTVIETLTAVRLCPAKRGTQSLVYRASEEAFAELDVLYDHAIAAFKQRVTASLCGVSSLGLASLRAAKYVALGLISGHGSPHDGAVEINSCGAAFGVDAYQTSWNGGRFYRASVNHADASLRNGDGLWGDDRKPLKWLNCQF